MTRASKDFDKFMGTMTAKGIYVQDLDGVVKRHSGWATPVPDYRHNKWMPNQGMEVTIVGELKPTSWAIWPFLKAEIK